jgi:hypothetical protein
MPQPDPSGLSDEREQGSFTVTAEIWGHGNRRHRRSSSHAFCPPKSRVLLLSRGFRAIL